MLTGERRSLACWNFDLLLCHHLVYQSGLTRFHSLISSSLTVYFTEEQCNDFFFRGLHFSFEFGYKPQLYDFGRLHHLLGAKPLLGVPVQFSSELGCYFSFSP